MVKGELWDHEETLLDGKLLHFLPLGQLATGNGCRHHCVTSATLLLLAEHGECVIDPRVQGDGTDGDL